jgi:hypothetical protein
VALQFSRGPPNPLLYSLSTIAIPSLAALSPQGRPKGGKMLKNLKISLFLE